MGIREQIEKVIRDESGSYQLMTGKMRAIDLDRCEEAFTDKIVSLISEAKESGWISVEDRFPEDLQRVLVSRFGEARVMSVITYRNIYSDRKYWGDSMGNLFDSPSHWMPLPQPPKSEESCNNCTFDSECRHKAMMPEGQKTCKFYVKSEEGA